MLMTAPAGRQHRLVRACVDTLKWSLLAVVVPRLFLLAFTICQPLVLVRFLVFLQDPSEDVDVGYALILAYGAVYVGISVSSSFYYHSVYRSVTMLRGLLVTAVFSKTTRRNITAGDDAAAVTLMSTDVSPRNRDEASPSSQDFHRNSRTYCSCQVDSITRAARQIHEFWANLVQIGVATWLLSTQIGLAASGAIVVCFASLGVTIFVSPLARKYQVLWVRQVQKRVGMLSYLLHSHC
jgi:hypothetical protein